MLNAIRSFLVCLLVFSVVAPVTASDFKHGRRLALCAGVFEAWSALLKERRIMPDQQHAADEFTWKGIRLKKQALLIISAETYRQGAESAMGEIFYLAVRQELGAIQKNVNACEELYAKTII